jgi:hypothetical protein
MSEKIYAWLLRLFPSHFREAYGDEALQLFRDRCRDETGVFPRLRLWLDLLGDLAVSVPRQYGFVQPVMVGASVQSRLSGVPSFFVLGDETPRLGALLFGGVLSLVALGAFSSLLSHDANHARTRTLASGDLWGQSRFAEQEATQPNSTEPATAMNRAAVPNGSLDAAERRRVIGAVIANLKQHYVYPDAAQKMSDALLMHERNGDDAAVTDGGAFADLLTKQMRDVSHDRHLELAYSQDPLPASRLDALGRPLGPTPEDQARYRKTLEQGNCTFEKAEVLAHNIGYLKLNSFPDPSICGPTAVAAMASLNHVDAIIFDLRDNRGGEPEMVALMAAYLFDRPEYWYNPRENTTARSWTHSPVPGNKLADKLVYVLTSARTFSGAEQFSYDLKMLKRAILVGETTGGAAHSGVFYRIDDHFGIGIPETKPINPFSKTDWAESGVEPDVKVKAADALETAVKLAESKLRK